MTIKELCVEVISSRADKFGKNLTDFMQANNLKALEDATEEQLFDFAWNAEYDEEARKEEARFCRLVVREVPAYRKPKLTPEEKRLRDRERGKLHYLLNRERELARMRANRAAKRSEEACQDTQKQPISSGS